MEPIIFEAGALMADDLLSTPQQRKRGHKLTTILEDSRRLFQREGYAAFTLRRAAAEAGVPLGTLQHYFPTREVLLKALIQQTIRTFNDHYQVIASSGGPATQRLTRLIEQILKEVRTPDDRLFMLELAALANHDKFAADVLAENYKVYLGIVTRLVSEISPTLTERESVVRALLIIAQLEGLLVVLNSGSLGTGIDDDAITHAVHVLVNSLSQVN